MTYKHNLKMTYKNILFIILLPLAKIALSAEYIVPDLLLGQAQLPQQVTHRELAQGIDAFQITRGYQGKDSYFVISSGIVSQAQAVKLYKQLSLLDYSVKIKSAPESAPNGKSLGKLVHLGRFKYKKQAEQVVAKLSKSIGHRFSIRYQPENSEASSGPFQISLLKVDLNRFQGTIKSALAHNHIQETATTSAIAKQQHAIAATNAGFFVWNDKIGTTGDLAGISVINGKLVSETVTNRPALVIDSTSNQLAIHHGLSNDIQLIINQQQYPLQGINRAAGKTLNCGAPFDPRLTQAAHDLTCSNPAEAIIYSHDFGEQVSLADGIALQIKNHQLVNIVKLSTTAQTFVLTQDTDIVYLSSPWLAKWLATDQDDFLATLKINQPARVQYQLRSQQQNIALKQGTYIINGGPTLLKAGKIQQATRAIEGWATYYQNISAKNQTLDEKDDIGGTANVHDRSGFYYGWVVRRHPRTAIGISADNQLYVAVVYGRQPGISAGASITEMAVMMQQLGAVEALNLDGGGSSMMVINGEKMGQSSDRSGERAVGDALLFIK